MKHSKYQKVKLKFSELSDIPKDVFVGAPIISVTGPYEAIIENHTGILEYTDTNLKIKSRICKILITGNNLKIEYYNNDDIKVKGIINDIKLY